MHHIITLMCCKRSLHSARYLDLIAKLWPSAEGKRKFLERLNFSWYWVSKCDQCIFFFFLVKVLKMLWPVNGHPVYRFLKVARQEIKKKKKHKNFHDNSDDLSMYLKAISVYLLPPKMIPREWCSKFSTLSMPFHATWTIITNTYKYHFEMERP